MVTNNNTATEFTPFTANYGKTQTIAFTSAAPVDYFSVFVFDHHCVNCNKMTEQEDKMDSSTIKKLVIIDFFIFTRIL